jgi:thiamine-phosphate pyrophosphorylase
MPQPPRPRPGSSNSRGARLPRLYVITDRRATGGRDLIEVIAAVVAAVPAGAAMVQVREKDISARALFELVTELRAVTAARGCALLVNDRLDVALAAGADGVHLPERGMDVAAARAVAGPGMIIGASTHGPDAAMAAARAGADVIVCGPVWDTPSKAGYGPPLGVEALAGAARAVAGSGVWPLDAEAGARLYALGGATTPERARQARQAGAYGVAGIRAFMAAADPGAAAARLYEAISAGQ